MGCTVYHLFPNFGILHEFEEEILPIIDSIPPLPIADLDLFSFRLGKG